jgi:hypothetical protein
VYVLAAVMDAVDAGYRVVLAEDALCSVSDEAHGAMLRLLAGRSGSSHCHCLIARGDFETILRPMLLVIGRHGNERRCDVLIARFSDCRAADRHAKPDSRTDRAAAAGESETSDPQTDRRRRVVEHMRSAEHRKAHGGIAAAIRTNQGDSRCGLKTTDQDMDGMVTGVVVSDGAVRSWQPRASACRESTDSDQYKECTAHRGM